MTDLFLFFILLIVFVDLMVSFYIITCINELKDVIIYLYQNKKRLNNIEIIEVNHKND